MKICETSMEMEVRKGTGLDRLEAGTSETRDLPSIWQVLAFSSRDQGMEPPGERWKSSASGCQWAPVGAIPPFQWRAGRIWDNGRFSAGGSLSTTPTKTTKATGGSLVGLHWQELEVSDWGRPSMEPSKGARTWDGPVWCLNAPTSCEGLAELKLKSN